jgi:hypothetical protein
VTDYLQSLVNFAAGTYQEEQPPAHPESYIHQQRAIGECVLF